MKYRACDKCGEIVTKTGFVSSVSISEDKVGSFGKCHNPECGKLFSEREYLGLKEVDFGF